ncbi:MAG TPA: MarR family transcriptional regulator [Nitrososphaerales archaeon]|nr:MarR family transcriptional regulator [Nitrososphaerales archaeon]
MQSLEITDLLLSILRRWRSESPVGRGVVTQEQYWVLKSLSDSGPQRLKDLADRLGCTPSSASVAVKRLERTGLVERKRAEADEREVRINLTGEGERQFAAWRGDRLGMMSTIFETLSRSERDQLEALLRKAVLAGEKPDGGSRGRARNV